MSSSQRGVGLRISIVLFVGSYSLLFPSLTSSRLMIIHDHSSSLIRVLAKLQG